jgi:hypothetical protein
VETVPLEACATTNPEHVSAYQSAKGKDAETMDAAVPAVVVVPIKNVPPPVNVSAHPNVMKKSAEMTDVALPVETALWGSSAGKTIFAATPPVSPIALEKPAEMMDAEIPVEIAVLD